jgi:hypothetical protein
LYFLKFFLNHEAYSVKYSILSLEKMLFSGALTKDWGRDNNGISRYQGLPDHTRGSLTPQYVWMILWDVSSLFRIWPVFLNWVTMSKRFGSRISERGSHRSYNLKTQTPWLAKCRQSLLPPSTSRILWLTKFWYQTGCGGAHSFLSFLWKPLPFRVWPHPSENQCRWGEKRWTQGRLHLSLQTEVSFVLHSLWITWLVHNESTRLINSLAWVAMGSWTPLSCLLAEQAHILNTYCYTLWFQHGLSHLKTHIEIQSSLWGMKKIEIWSNYKPLESDQD